MKACNGGVGGVWPRALVAHVISLSPSSSLAELLYNLKTTFLRLLATRGGQ